MKIVYISQIFSLDNMAGVEGKLKAESRYMKKHGVETIVVTNSKDEVCGEIFFVSLDKRLGSPAFLGMRSRMWKLWLISKVVDLDACDVIILRYPLMDFSSLWFSRKYGHKTITEHHGKELEEIGNYRIHKIFKIGQYGFEKYLAPLFFRNIAGMVGISDDLLEYEAKRTGFEGKSMRFANGIDPDDFPRRGVPELRDEFRMLFIASNYSAWHGLDRLLESLAEYSGAWSIRLTLIGVVNDSFDALVRKAQDNSKIIVDVVGKKYGDELDPYFAESHMACDSLAMHRLSMVESSTLKSKEYVARSMPFLFSAPDKDLESVREFLFDAGSDENRIDMDAVIEHYRSIDHQKMRDVMDVCARQVLDWDVKVANLKRFVEEAVR
tara:strand:- start:44171 stop:45313 length:1143 start_codon:yes stop_codon:yes gene_type:complete